MTQKQKQSVIVNLNLDKAQKKRKRRKAVKRGGGGGGPSRGVGTMFPYGFPPQQQSVQPTLNNITDYLKMKEGQDNGRHVNIMAAMRAIQRDEGRQGTAVQTELGAGTSTQAPTAPRASKGGGGGGPVEEALRYIDLPEAPVVPLKDVPPDMRATDFRIKAVETGGAVILKRSLKKTHKPEAASEPDEPIGTAKATSELTAANTFN